MKKIYLWAIMPFLIACSNDSIESELIEQTMKNSFSTRIEHPYNPSNEFDEAGQLHNELSESYVVSVTIPTTVGAVLMTIDSIARRNELFQRIKGQDYTMPPTFQVERILEKSVTDIGEALSNSSLSNSAKGDLVNFIRHVRFMETSRDAYSDIYDYIISAEINIQNNIAYSQRDRELLLITTSITRHASYFAREQKKKPRDKDWDLVIANIIAATEGAEESGGKAAVMATTAGIASNY